MANPATSNEDATDAKKDNGIKVTKSQIVEFVKATISSDRDAPVKGKSFIQDTAGVTRVYLRLRPLADALEHGDTPGKVREAIEQLGFSRRPFSYTEGSGDDSRQTSASYYSAEASSLRGLGRLEHRTSSD